MTQTPSAFALDLSNDGIFLWHRKPEQKWEFLGSVPLTSGNLRQQLEGLKHTAETVDAGPRSAIVRIPSAEVRTFALSDDPDAIESLEHRLVEQLEKAAGLPIKEVVFDLERTADHTVMNVAWTPLDVIKQAETFVHMIGFTPSNYTTDVEQNAFPRRPSFQIPAPPAPTQVQAQAPVAPQAALTPTPSVETETIDIADDIQDPVDDVPIMENIFQEHTDDIDAAPAPQATAPVEKAGFGFAWFLALFLIIGTVIAVLYLWPKIHQSDVSEADVAPNQPIIAKADSPQIFPFEKTKLSL